MSNTESIVKNYRLDNLVKLKISPQNSDGSLLTDEEFKSQKMGIMTEKTKLEERLGHQGQKINNWVETVERNFEFAIHTRYKFEHGSSEEKREIVATVGSNLKLFKQTLTLELQNDYGFLEEITEKEPTTSYGFEPSNQIDNSIQLEDYWAKNLTVLPIPSYNINIEKIIHEFTLFQQSYSSLSLSN